MAPGCQLVELDSLLIQKNFEKQRYIYIYIYIYIIEQLIPIYFIFTWWTATVVALGIFSRVIIVKLILYKI